MSYLPNPGEMNHLPSSVLGGGMMGRGGGGVDLTASMMGGGVDLSTLGGGLGGLSGEDMMHSQPNADSTDISMLSGYMSSAHHVSNPKAQHLTQTLHHPQHHYHHQYGMGMGADVTTNTTSGAGSAGLPNGILKNSGDMSHLRHHHDELPYMEENHIDTFHEEPDPYYFHDYDIPSHMSSRLGSHHSHFHASALLPDHDLLAQDFGVTTSSADWQRGRGIDIGGSSRPISNSGLAASAPVSQHYLRHNNDSAATDYLYQQHRHHQQQDRNYGSGRDYRHDYMRSSTAPPAPAHPHTLQRPTSAPLHNSNYYNNQQYRTHHAGYAGPSSASAYESNLSYATDHYSNRPNLNAHYSSGGPGGDHTSGIGGLPIPGGGGFLGGGRGMGGGHPPNPHQGSNLFSGPGGPGFGVAGEDEVRQQSVSSESQAYYGNETMVKELRPEFVRWFYRYEQDRKWKPFTGYDSIRIESKYRDVFRDQISSYSHSAYYPVASSNDESTDFSKFLYQQHGNPHAGMNSYGPGYPHHPHGMSGMEDMSQTSNMINQKWWPGKGPDTTVDTEFNNGGPGFPSQVRNNSMGANVFGRGGNAAGVQKERMLHKANSTSALLGGPGLNGYNAMGPNHYPDLNKVVVVREGLYEVDLDSWTCFSTYWPGDTCVITRGTWFYDGTWDPLPVEQAEKLEEAHMSKFCGSSLINHAQQKPPQSQGNLLEDPLGKLGAAAAGTTNNAPAIHRISFNDFHVDWTSPTDVFWYSTATSHKLMRSVGQKLGFSDWGHRICRGYYKPALIMDRPSEISHIVFVIHGIGQKMDTGRIVRNCSAFRDCVASMKEKYFPQLNNAKQRAEFFPVEWRSAIKLDGDIVEAITPQKLVTLRQLLNSTAMDIMYYTSPLYRAEIQNALIDELNRIYANFAKRNPNFTINGGKVSVMAHSLGAVIMYDIITGYLCGSVEDEISLMQQQFHHIPRRVVHPQQGLLFTLEHFFCLGSPLSVFLALRWREPHDPALRNQILPHHLCRRIYNVFYPSDPVAYRLEPLLNRHYAKIAPLTIHSYNAPTKPRYSDMPRERITTVVSKTASDNTTTTIGPSFLPTSSTDPTAQAQQKASTSIPKSLPSFPSVLKPPTISMPNMPQSPSKDGNSQNWGGWFGGNIMKLWKGSTSPATGLLDQTGLTGGITGGIGGLTGQQQQNPNSAPHPPPPQQPEVPAAVGDLAGAGMTHPLDDASFLAQQTKDNYATVVDEEPLNIQNDLDYRLDYVLRESQFSGSSYIAALTSHTSYWNSPDAAYFVMTHLYDDLIEQTNSYSGVGER